MITTCIKNSRHEFLGTGALGATAFTARGAFAEELTGTPTANEGPFYPLCRDFVPITESRIGELAARWEIVLGYSPEA
jgi:hypothetical protein